MSDNQSDAMIGRLEAELEERNAFVQGTIASAQDASRDLSDNETELLRNAKSRVDNIKSQLDTLYDTRTTTIAARQRAQEVQQEFIRMRQTADSGPVEYRSAGEYARDLYLASLGDRDSKDRLSVFTRAAAHQKTADNLGVVPDPIVGEVVNFIDASRPIVNSLGAMDLPAATWHRPKVTQHASVAVQGSAGAAADEKTELVSQKLLVTRLTANAVTYGGYVNVSRQNIDLGRGVLDLVINDLAAQYAIETEAATGAALATGTGSTVLALAGDADATAAAVWDAAAAAYTATKGQGSLVLAVGANRLGQFGPLFAPYGPQNNQGQGFLASKFGQGPMGTISGIPTVMSAGIAADEAFLFSTAAIEAYEQRVGALQVTEPSVLGVQVAYAGYFTPLVVEAAGIIEFTTA